VFHPPRAKSAGPTSDRGGAEEEEASGKEVGGAVLQTPAARDQLSRGVNPMSETTTKPAPRQRKKPVRFCKIVHNPSGYGYDVLVIRQPRPKSVDLVDYYAVEAFPSYMGERGIELTKRDGTVYHVNLSGSDSTCDCKGFTSHGHCKHVESLLALQQRGKL